MPNPALTEAVYYILLSLMQPMHGYGIMQNAEKLSGGRVRLAAGTLYGALNSLMEKGWICALPGGEDSPQPAEACNSCRRQHVAPRTCEGGCQSFRRQLQRTEGIYLRKIHR